MLYSIIPPALVIISLVGIIIILMKKAPQVARLEDGRKLFSEEEKNERELSARYAALKRENRKSFKERSLAIITKTGGASKGTLSFFGRFFRSGKSALGKINESARAKIEAKAISRKRQVPEEAEENFFQRRIDKQIQITDEEEYFPEGLVGSSGAEPEEKKVEKKDIFEKILIDRIASNPKDIEAYERLGEYYLEIESWEYAKECFKQVIKLNPRNINARSRMRKLEKILSK